MILDPLAHSTPAARRARFEPRGLRIVMPCPLRTFAILYLLSSTPPLLPLAAATADTEELIRRSQSGTLLEKEGEVKFQPAALPEVPARLQQPLTFGEAL